MTTLFLAALTLTSFFAPSSQVSIDPTFTPPKSSMKVHFGKPGPDGEWIWAKRVADKQNILLTREFEVTKTPRNANLYLTVDNFYSVSLDGKTLASTKAGIDDIEGWRTAKIIDVTPLMTLGKHKLEIAAYNEGGPAGVLFRLDLDGHPSVISNEKWTAVDQSANGSPEPATVEAKAGAGPWGGDISGWPSSFVGPPDYLSHLALPPVQIATDGNYADPDNVSWSPSNSDLTLTSPTPGKPWKVILDFGKELSGRVVVKSKNSVIVKVGTGESVGEAIQKPYTASALAVDASNLGATRYSAFRFASLEFPASENTASLNVTVDHLYYPVKYSGSFDCSDPLLTKIWYTGAYTTHLCMQEDIWDAPKRDRARWMGDLQVSGEVINNVFLDKFLMEQTMSRLRADAQGDHKPGQLPSSHVNGIPGYSCAWLSGLADFYKHTGDLAYIKTQKDAIATMIEFFRGEIGPSGTFRNNRHEWPFVDWSPDYQRDSPESWGATHLFMVKAIEDGAFLLRKCGDTADADKDQVWAEGLKSTAQTVLINAQGTYGKRRQENAMAVYSGVATDVQKQAIYDNVLKPGLPSWSEVVSPYYNNYVIFAMSQLGHNQDAMDFIRAFWGGMLREGATTFWEGYDTSWDKNNSHVHLQADDGTGYFVSLCHGWSCGVTNWLTEQVAGIRSLDGGFSECEIQPNLGDLKFVSSEVPTPSGKILVRVDRTETGFKVHLTLPSSVKKAHIKLDNVIPGKSLPEKIITKSGHYLFTVS